MQLFVTGAAGFIGSNYVRHVLATTDDRVTIFDALTYAGNESTMADVLESGRVTFVHGDICDRDAVAAALPVIPATSGTSAGAIPLYVIATAAYLTTSVLLHRIAVD